MGGSGGGGGSGKVDYPGYMKTWHEDVLGSYTGKSISTAIDEAHGSSPFATATAYDPTTEANRMTTKVDDTALQITKMDQIGEQVEFENKIYPRFESGMRDINAVQSSAFVQGRANIAADYAARLSSKKMELCVQHEQAYIDANRMAIIAFQGQVDKNVEFDAKDVKWDLEMYQYGANALASIGSGAVPAGGGGGKEVSDGQQALAGAATGATMGASFGPWGAAIGAVVGGAAGYLM